MSEQAGFSVGAIRTRQAALFDQHNSVVDADRVFAELLAGAHAAVRESVGRLDAIAAEIDGAVADESEPGIDTPLRAREFQRFLIAKQREIAAIVARTHDIQRAKKAVLEGLREHYSVSGL